MQLGQILLGLTGNYTLLKMGCCITPLGHYIIPLEHYIIPLGHYIIPLGHYTILVIKKLQRVVLITGMA